MILVGVPGFEKFTGVGGYAFHIFHCSFYSQTKRRNNMIIFLSDGRRFGMIALIQVELFHHLSFFA